MSENRIEVIILKNLFHNQNFVKKVLPFLKVDYWKPTHEKLIFSHTLDYINEYEKLPTISEIAVAIEKDKIVEETYKECLEILTELETNEEVNYDWLINETEHFCKDRALVLAAYKSVAILEGKDKKLDSGSIPKIFEDALSVNFDTNIGHSYFDDAEKRYDTLHAEEYKLPFDIDFLNKVTKGGVSRKTLNLLVAGIYVGKTLGLCHLARSYLCQGKNVLYITLEVSEENIGNRIDTNLLDISIDDISDVPRDIFIKKALKAREQNSGSLIIKEYPAGSIHVNHLRALINELYLKKKFRPDVIMIDYLNLMASSRIKPTEKTHLTIQAIAEEIRALAQEFDVPIWSATQLSAEGLESSDPTITEVSGSRIGLLATVDLAWFIVCSEKLRELGQLLFIQHKNRYKDATDNKKFYVGIDRKKFRLFDIEQKGQMAAPSKDPLEDEGQMRREISKKHGSQPYVPGYKQKFGSSKKFSDFKV
jgi:replicative DNA helicase